ncbi:hypothetical protein [Streptomyces hygroscopicus]|uniref:hypothetical protein n=1 Tax=Streptomyces hygroscopicus TaxID=1912 RepID=UPI003F1E10EB
MKVKAETDVKKAEKEADVAHWAVKDAEKKVEEIKKALESVTKSATDALGRKKSALNAINKKTKKPDVTQDNNKVNPQDSANTHQPVKDTTESDREWNKKPTIPNPDQPGSENNDLVLKIRTHNNQSKTNQWVNNP